MTRTRPTPPPIPTHVRQRFPEWSPAMRKVRRAMMRGCASEEAIGYGADLDSWTTRAALELLALTGEIVRVRDARWRGLTTRTTEAGTKARAEAATHERPPP